VKLRQAGAGSSRCARSGSFILTLDFSAAPPTSSFSLFLFFFSFLFGRGGKEGRFAPRRASSPRTAGSRSIRIGIAFDRNSMEEMPGTLHPFARNSPFSQPFFSAYLWLRAIASRGSAEKFAFRGNAPWSDLSRRDLAALDDSI